MLPACDPPYASVEHLTQEFGFSDIRSGSSCSFEILSPSWLSFDATHLKEDVIEVVMSSPWENLDEQGHLSFIPVRNADRGKRQHVKIEPMEEQATNGWPSYVARIALDRSPGPTIAHVIIEGRSVASTPLFGFPAARMDVHGIIDPDFSRIWNRLAARRNFKARSGDTQATRPDARAFEEGVVWLLALCGLTPIQYGVGTEDSLDVVAHYNDRLLLAGECTVKLPIPGKVQRFLQRVGELEEGLKAAGREIRVGKTFFVACSETLPGLKERRQELEERDIVLVCKDDLERLLQSAMEGKLWDVYWKLTAPGWPYSAVKL